jgi:hypothetical protein
MQINSSYLILTVIFVLLWLENISDHLFSYDKMFFVTYQCKLEIKKQKEKTIGFQLDLNLRP